MDNDFGVKVKHLPEFVNEQGAVQHMLRNTDDEFFRPVAEVYFSIVNPGVTKGWHCHQEQTSLLSCISGKVELAIWGPVGKTEAALRFLFGDGDRKLILIPPGLTYGWRNLSPRPSILANCATHVHDPSKSTKRELDELTFDWSPHDA